MPSRRATEQNWQPAAASGDFDDAEGGAVDRRGDGIEAGTGAFDTGWQGFAPDGALEKIHDDLFGLAVDEAVDAPGGSELLVFNLPGAGAAKEDFEVVAVGRQGGMGDEAAEFGGVDGFALRAIKAGVDIGGERDAEGIVGVIPMAGGWADKLGSN